ncbi:acid-sensing ion channel 1A-like [Parasteatoda tepidariorum]|uniref:acid-sensing ion channel 1A-like n=1 Tax=Parasteatoda tepidariorum TaxID=114398 RepID=UPI00077FDBDF|nr:acid-sensing ion channel 4-B-like [Parasteatoda tepidariorum]
MSPNRTPTPYPVFRRPKSNTKDEKNVEKEDLKDYCKDMLANSMLTGVPQIVSAPTTRSRVFKTFVVLGSFTGFLYQTSAFLVIYFSYPTLVDLQVTTPPMIDLPALTICNRNGLKRTNYCKMKPENCEPVEYADFFCQRYPEACENGRIKGNSYFPTLEAQSEEVTATQDMIQKAGHTSYPLISSCHFEGLNRTHDFCKNTTFKSFVFQDLYGRMKKCYIINALWQEARLNLPQVPTRAVLKMVIDLEPDEYFRIDETVTGQVAIHSPWNILNPFSEGFLLKPRKTYVIHLKEDIKNLLPYPYQTNCTDYIKTWQIRGGNGPLSKEMCIEECILNQTMDNCQCVLTENLYPHNFKFCGEEMDDCLNSINYTFCYVRCAPACHDRNFDYDIKEEDVMKDTRVGHAVTHNWNRTAILLIIFKRTNVNVFRYRAKYDSIELFSFLGGFIGIWLGVSLIALLDFLESLSTLIVYVFDRFKNKHKITNIQSAIGSRIRSNSTFSTDSMPWAKDAKEHPRHLGVNVRKVTNGHY